MFTRRRRRDARIPTELDVARETAIGFLSNGPKA